MTIQGGVISRFSAYASNLGLVPPKLERDYDAGELFPLRKRAYNKLYFNR